MKFPFDFSTKLIFRLVLPGAILAAALAPALHALLHACGIWIRIQYLYPFEVIAWGWVIVTSDMRIYMLFEGRRYWPQHIRYFFLAREQARLSALKKVLDSSGKDRRRFLEAGVEYSAFPVDEGGDAYAEHPTRFGNLTEAFETYPKVKYGLDAIFYWYRLWAVLDKELREEIDNAQSVADSAIYVAFVLYLSGVAMVLYAAIGGLLLLLAPFLRTPTSLALPYVPGPLALLLLAAGCLAFGFAVFRCSLPIHGQFGELFKSVFDQYRSKLVVDDVVSEVGRITGDTCLISQPQRVKNQIVWRYLRWHMIRDESLKKSFTVKEWPDRHRGAAAGKN